MNHLLWDKKALPEVPNEKEEKIKLKQWLQNWLLGLQMFRYPETAPPIDRYMEKR